MKRATSLTTQQSVAQWVGKFQHFSIKLNIFFFLLNVHPSLLLDTPVDNIKFSYVISVVIQTYEAEADNEYVIRGNSAIMKCEIPSFVSDFVFVDSWEDSDGNTFYYDKETPGTEGSRCNIQVLENSQPSFLYFFLSDF